MNGCSSGSGYKPPQMPAPVACDNKSYSPMVVLDWECQEKFAKCTPVKFSDGKYYIATQADAEGDPTLVENQAMWVGGFTKLDGSFFAALLLCTGLVEEDTFNMLSTNEDGTIKVQRVNKQGNNVDAPYNVGSSTPDDKHLASQVIVGNVLTTTMTDGTIHQVTITHPTFPADVKVSGFDITGDTVTVTMSDGSTFTDTVTHPAATTDVKLVDAVIAGGNITYTMSDGSTFTRPHPAGGTALPVTDYHLGQGLWLYNSGPTGHAYDTSAAQGFGNAPIVESYNSAPVTYNAATGVFTATADCHLAVTTGIEVNIGVGSSSNIDKLYALCHLANFGVVGADLSRHTRTRAMMNHTTGFRDDANLAMSDSRSHTEILYLGVGGQFKPEWSAYVTGLAGGAVNGNKRCSVSIAEVSSPHQHHHA